MKIEGLIGNKNGFSWREGDQWDMKRSKLIYIYMHLVVK